MVDGISQNVGTQQALTAGTKKSAAAQNERRSGC